jgi:hypothetical protein
VAQAIHRRSPRRSRPYLAVNMEAIPAALAAAELFGAARAGPSVPDGSCQIPKRDRIAAFQPPLPLPLFATPFAFGGIFASFAAA